MLIVKNILCLISSLYTFLNLFVGLVCRCLNNSSNSFSVFDASNLFYGGRIYEGSYELIDPAFTGSNGTMRVTLKDNKRGD